MPIGVVRSSLVDLAAAPMQGDERAPDATIDVEPSFASALEGIGVGDELKPVLRDEVARYVPSAEAGVAVSACR